MEREHGPDYRLWTFCRQLRSRSSSSDKISGLPDNGLHSSRLCEMSPWPAPNRALDNTVENRGSAGTIYTTQRQDFLGCSARSPFRLCPLARLPPCPPRMVTGGVILRLGPVKALQGRSVTLPRPRPQSQQGSPIHVENEDSDAGFHRNHPHYLEKGMIWNRGHLVVD